MNFPSLDAGDFERTGELQGVPQDVSFLAAKPNQQVARANIGFKWHAGTQHTAIENFQPPSYYEDYLMTASYSEKMQAHQGAQARALAELARLEFGRASSFVEIGCGDGSFLSHAAQHIPRVLGIEASAPFAQEARGRGHEVLCGYVGVETPLTTEKFDCFASRQVFEHLPDPVSVLRGARLLLREGGVGLVEVPNGLRSVLLARFYDFFPDHVQYYSVNSLVALANDAGFNVIRCHESFGGDYLELWVRYLPGVEERFARMGRQKAQLCAALLETLVAEREAGRKTMIWGCGAKTLSILAGCEGPLDALVAGVIDSDPHKAGKYVPNTSIRVMPPAEAFAATPETVFVLALSYREEIAAEVRRNLPACRAIFSFDDEGRVARL